MTSKSIPNTSFKNSCLNKFDLYHLRRYFNIIAFEVYIRLHNICQSIVHQQPAHFLRPRICGNARKRTARARGPMKKIIDFAINFVFDFI